MRNLLITMGSPASGKSTWIKENNLEQYTIAPDNLRMLVSQPNYQTNGKMTISQERDKKVWDLLDELLEERMSKGQFTVIDATHTREKYLRRYKDLAEKYRYRLYVKRFEVELEELLKRNSKRDEHKQVPEDIIALHHSRMQAVEVPSKYQLINSVDEINEFIRYEQLDKAHWFIGDIHGCYDQIKTFLDEHYNENDMFVFTGDYIDRGTQNAETVNLLLEYYTKPNVVFLEGNHEQWLRKWAEGDLSGIRSKEFINRTMAQLEGKVDKKEVRMFTRKLRAFYTADINGLKVIACHGGVPTPFPHFISSEQLINGVGDYESIAEVYNTFNSYGEEYLLAHGHRNNPNYPPINGNCLNLDGHVEFGGELRVVKVDREEIGGDTIKFITRINTFGYKNENYVPREAEAVKESGARFTGILPVDKLRSSKLVKERVEGDISSFNFTHKAFTDKHWNDETIKARGFFINNKTNDIVARSYDKFFNYKETEETSPFQLAKTLSFPVTVWQKYNGFLGIVGYDKTNDKVLYCSKSSITGDHAVLVKEILDLNGVTEDKLRKVVEKGYSLIFEVIDAINDPHIIDYGSERNVTLLNCVKNAHSEEFMGQDELTYIAGDILQCKSKLALKSISSYPELEVYIESVQNDYDTETEGVVIEDSKGFKFKAKGGYYNRWKRMRSVKDNVFKQGFRVTDFAFNPVQMEFLTWCKTKDEDYIKSRDIIKLRNEFYEK